MPIVKVDKFENDELEKLEYAYVDPKRNIVNEVWYEKGLHPFEREELDEANEKFLKSNADAMERILADGYTEYPLIEARDWNGEYVEGMKAWLPPGFEPSCMEGFYEKYGMHTNIYIPSSKRAGLCKTVNMLQEFGVKNFYICVNPDQYLDYLEYYPKENIIVREIGFRYDNMLRKVSSFERPLGMAGHAPLCNFTLALSRSLGESHFSFADDDFPGLGLKARKGDKKAKPKEKYVKDNYYRCSKLGAENGFNFQDFWSRFEEFVSNIRNAGFAGIEKYGLAYTEPISIKFGSRVYSFYITTNDNQPDHFGYQNNDIITSLEQHKYGFVNILGEGFTYESDPTQKGGGGGQTKMYKKFGTLEKGKILVRAQPNYSKVVHRFNRIHHTAHFGVTNKMRLVGAPVENWDRYEPGEHAPVGEPVATLESVREGYAKSESEAKSEPESEAKSED